MFSQVPRRPIVGLCASMHVHHSNSNTQKVHRVPLSYNILLYLLHVYVLTLPWAKTDLVSHLKENRNKYIIS